MSQTSCRAAPSCRKIVYGVVRSPRGLSLREPLEPFRSSWLTGWARESLGENSRVRGACLFSSPGLCSSTPLRMSVCIILVSRGWGPVLRGAIFSQSLGTQILFVFLFATGERLPLGRRCPGVYCSYRSESIHTIHSTTISLLWLGLGLDIGEIKTSKWAAKFSGGRVVGAGCGLFRIKVTEML
jgi:hypothetical protein